MRHGSLFSGIGGFDLAAQWMGWENVFHCEFNPFGRRVLKHYWPNAISYKDVTKTDFSIHRGQIDILTGGFPCQPYSTAGKRKGKEDERHLWPEMLRAIQEIKPSYVVGENVRGLVSWNGGLVFDEVQADLEDEGYEVLPFLLPACGVNAPHRRDRIWFVAYSDHLLHKGELDARADSQEASGSKGTDKQQARTKDGQRVRAEFGPSSTDVADATGARLERCSRPGIQRNCSRFAKPSWDWLPTQPPICNGDDGIPAKLDGITVSAHRRESIKAGGNAIVPQVAYQIFKAINEIK
jgi:DNA (cytosine-5)-methyltransferase 1